jgi:hypothetical protein
VFLPAYRPESNPVQGAFSKEQPLASRWPAQACRSAWGPWCRLGMFSW